VELKGEKADLSSSWGLYPVHFGVKTLSDLDALKWHDVCSKFNAAKGIRLLGTWRVKTNQPIGQSVGSNSRRKIFVAIDC
jgi:hypothetical protein